MGGKRDTEAMTTTTFDLTINAAELTREDGESYEPARLVLGSFIDIDVTDENGLTVWSDIIEVTDELTDPEEVAVERLERAGFVVEGEIGPEWLATSNGESATTGHVRLVS